MEMKEALRRIETGEAFSLEWVMLDVSRNKGGKIRHEHGLRLLVAKEDAIGSSSPKPKPRYSYQESCQYIKLFHEATGRYFTVYKRLMLSFNGQQIEY